MAVVPNNEMMALMNTIEMENVPGVTNNPISTTIDPENIATAPSMKQSKKNQLVGSKKKRAKQQKEITSPEPTYIESEYELKRKERIKQNKERLKSLGLDLSIGELAKKMNSSVDGEKKEKGGQRYKKVQSTSPDSKRKTPEQTEFEVDKIVSHRKNRRGKYQFLTKWEGYTSDENTWEDANEKVKEIPLLVQKYLSTINNKELLASSELQKIYDESIRLAPLETEENEDANKLTTGENEDANENIPLMMSTDNIMKQPTEVQLITSRAHELDTERCGHRDHSKMRNYMWETDTRMCDQGKYCHGKMCRNCKALFDAELDGDVEGQLFVKPSKEHPVWVCIGLKVDLRRCVEAMCDNCAQQMPDYSEIRMHVL